VLIRLDISLMYRRRSPGPHWTFVQAVTARGVAYAGDQRQHARWPRAASRDEAAEPDEGAGWCACRVDDTPLTVSTNVDASRGPYRPGLNHGGVDGTDAAGEITPPDWQILLVLITATLIMLEASRSHRQTNSDSMSNVIAGPAIAILR